MYEIAPGCLTPVEFVAFGFRKEAIGSADNGLILPECGVDSSQNSENMYGHYRPPPGPGKFVELSIVQSRLAGFCQNFVYSDAVLIPERA